MRAYVSTHSWPVGLDGVQADSGEFYGTSAEPSEYRAGETLPRKPAIHQAESRTTRREGRRHQFSLRTSDCLGRAEHIRQNHVLEPRLAGRNPECTVEPASAARLLAHAGRHNNYVETLQPSHDFYEAGVTASHVMRIGVEKSNEPRPCRSRPPAPPHGYAQISKCGAHGPQEPRQESKETLDPRTADPAIKGSWPLKITRRRAG